MKYRLTKILILLIIISVNNTKAQTDLKSHLVGQWTVKSEYDIGGQVPTDVQQQIKIVKDAFKKSKFHFKKDNSFSLDIEFQEISIKNGHWKILKDNNKVVIQEWKDKDKSGPILMGINVLLKDSKTIFMLEETFLAFEMTKISEE